MKAGAPEQQRLVRLRRVLRRRTIAALLVTARDDIRYLTGFTGSAGQVLVTSRSTALITDFRYKEQAARQTRGIQIVIQKRDAAAAVRETADRLRGGRVSFDESSLTVEQVRLLRRKGLRMKGIGDPVAELRQCKDPVEISRIRKAIGRAEASFRELRLAVRPGMTERELALRLEFLMRERGASRSAFDIIVASGANGSMPHATVSDRRLRDGDLVTVDFGAEADGYFCDITRTFCIGRPSARQREVHGLVLRAQEQAIKAVRPGVPCASVDAAARDIITAAGHGDHFGHATGHGIGLAVHEGPSLSALSKQVLAPGMVVTVEPGVYIPRWGGVRIEDMVLVTDRGSRLLTSLPRDL